jgi:hypothetical protein
VRGSPLRVVRVATRVVSGWAPGRSHQCPEYIRGCRRLSAGHEGGCGGPRCGGARAGPGGRTSHHRHAGTGPRGGILASRHPLTMASSGHHRQRTAGFPPGTTPGTPLGGIPSPMLDNIAVPVLNGHFVAAWAAMGAHSAARHSGGGRARHVPARTP